jgi:hypothetical protein
MWMKAGIPTMSPIVILSRLVSTLYRRRRRPRGAVVDAPPLSNGGAYGGVL